MIERRNKASLAAENHLSLMETDDDDSPLVPEESKRKQAPFCKKQRYCSYRSIIFTLSSIFFYIILRTTSNFSPRAASDPCQVARETADQLKRLEKRPQQDSFPSDWKPQLPNIIHHQWKDEKIPEKYQKWYQQWQDLYPNHTHILWTDASARQLIQQHYPWFLDIYDNYKYPIQRADAARYFYLHHYGGLHADLDYEPLVDSIFQYLPQDRVALVESPYKFSESTQNSLMSSPKGDPFWLNVFELLQKNKDKRVLAATGPQLLDGAIQTSSHAIHVLPCENFHRIPLGERKHSPIVTDIVRETLGRLYPMKQCGKYQDKACHFARHHNTAVYVSESTWKDLLWNI